MEMEALASPPVIGICRDGMHNAGAETKDALEDSATRLSAAGAKTQEFSFPCDVESFSAATKIINDVERARATAWEWDAHQELISERMRAAIEAGFGVPSKYYFAALNLLADCRTRLRAALDDVDIFLAPCVSGEAPLGLDYTGDPFFQGLWTALHVPAISLPTHHGPNALPVGIQLIGKNYGDDALLSAARWVFAQLKGD
jgi:amidase